MGIGELLQTGLSGLILLGAAAIMLSGLLGMMRFPDFYTRLHAAAMAFAWGGALTCLALAVDAQSLLAGVKLVLCALLLAAMHPVIVYVLTNAAHAGGLTPLSGAYTAPRPGAINQPPRSRAP